MKIFKKVREICIIGVGRYGSAITKQLLTDRENNLRIILIDSEEKHLTPFKDEVEMIYVADCAEQKSLEAINVKDFDVVIVSASNNIEIVAALCEQGVKSIIARATTRRHAQVLRQIGVHTIISPEEEAGKKTAMLVLNPTLSLYSENMVELQDGFVSASIYARSNEIIDKKISELGFRNKYGVVITMIKREHLTYIPEGDFKILENDLITFIGRVEDVTNVFKFCTNNKK
ncbi:potassium channel family protein [Metamycoplasma equirhinis]|uniref:TrkA family potassium uptake protein n=1 Tax=Metamycoplasma equirhinis TaxID=92402 RepID=A0ABZ0P9Y6_9BACT|nr:TrkA family potassium uptake protein [Metamycoplasma equirhinis]TPD99428.1 TrkA family potassium uptake protein [Metamycoplasma equirhinis]WPB53828.1 TrkA family potassium uptake protein [Metamycoplasma equirhinis]